MKKNKPMRAAGLLLLVTLLTTCLTAGTFAKYTTGDEASDTARVAKFGVVVKAEGDLYGKTYFAGSNSSNPNQPAFGTDSGVTVKSSNDDKVVAPGTKNDTGLGFSITGQPEVTVKVETAFDSGNKSIFLKAGSYGVMVDATAKVNADNFAAKKAALYTVDNATYSKLAAAAAYDAGTTYYELTGAVTLTDAYYPVVYKLSKAGTDDNLLQDGEVAYKVDTLAKLQTKLGGYVNNVTYAPNTNLDENAQNEYVITWEWAFERAGDTDGTYNKADTILGDLAAKNDAAFTGTVVEKSGETYAAVSADSYNLNTSFEASVSVTQVD